MFLEIRDQLVEKPFEELDPKALSVGFITAEELDQIGTSLGIESDVIEASRKANPLFRTGVDVRENYTFAELRILEDEKADDYVSLIIMKHMLLIVNIIDEDGSTKESFLKILKRSSATHLNTERLIFYFTESLLSGGSKTSEAISNHLAQMEETIISGEADKEMNGELLEIKKKLLKYQNFYSQLLDVSEQLGENENDILNEEDLIYITNLTGKISRLKEDIGFLSNYADHLQEAYMALLDQRMNQIMKIFTVITTIFFPLTIIVGWYGMNFNAMPEFAWNFGYLYVIALSVITVAALVIIGKVKKWF